MEATVELSASERLYKFYKDSADAHFNNGNFDEAKKEAHAWAVDVSRRLNLKPWYNWKEFKRSLAAKYFGEPERRVFNPGWDPGEVFAYVDSFVGRTLRLSLFPNGIACHSRSFRIPSQRLERISLIEKLDNSCLIEVFPESSTDSSICFRYYYNIIDGSYIFESGLGQATYVFEEEQGKHSVFTVVGSRNSGCKQFTKIAIDGDRFELEQRSKYFIEHEKSNIDSKMFGICRMLGIDFSAVEGYFDFKRSSHTVIVDTDLPFDYYFFIR